MIQVYKIFTSIDNTEANKFFIVEHGRKTRGHNKKIKKKACHLDIRKNSFSNRVVKFWNGLPQEVVECNSIATFKKGLDRYMDGLGIISVSYTHLRAHETPEHLVCRLLLEKKK